MRVRLDLVLDLRESALCAALALQDAPYRFVEHRDLCQQTASGRRHQTNTRGILVPAIGLIDQPERWVLVVFADKLPSYPEPFLSDVTADGTLPNWFEWSKL